MKINAMLGKRMSLEEIADAFAAGQSGHTRGKNVIVL